MADGAQTKANARTPILKGSTGGVAALPRTAHKR